MPLAIAVPAGEDSTHTLLKEHTRLGLLLLPALERDQTELALLHDFGLSRRLVNAALDEDHALLALATSVSFLNYHDGRPDIDLENHRIHHLLDFRFIVVPLTVLNHQLAHEGVLDRSRHWRFFLDLFLVALLTFLFLLLGNFFLFSAVFANHTLLECQLDGNAIILPVVARDWDLNDTGVVTQIEEQLVQVHVY